MNYSSSFDGEKPGGKIPDKGAMMEQVRTQLAVAQAQSLIQRLSEKCFEKCVPKPASSLDSSEQRCIAMCMDRYLEATELVSGTCAKRIQKESSRM